MFRIMEQEELIQERDVLFESLKSGFSELFRKNRILFVTFCLIIGILVFGAIDGSIYWLGCLACCIFILIPVCHNMISFNKLAKAENAQDFLSMLDEYRKISKWMNIAYIPLGLIVIIMCLISRKPDFNDVSWIIIFTAFYFALSWFGSNAFGARDTRDQRNNDIARLREIEAYRLTR